VSEECQAGQFSTSGRDLGLACHLKFAASNPPFSFVCRVHEISEADLVVDILAVRKRSPYDYRDLEALLEGLG